jgi:hypothetical protein
MVFFMIGIVGGTAIVDIDIDYIVGVTFAVNMDNIIGVAIVVYMDYKTMSNCMVVCIDFLLVNFLHCFC